MIDATLREMIDDRLPGREDFTIILSRPSERSERSRDPALESRRSRTILCRCAAIFALDPGSARRYAALGRDKRIRLNLPAEASNKVFTLLLDVAISAASFATQR